MKRIGLVLVALIVMAGCTHAKSSTAPSTSTVAVTTDPTTTVPPSTTTTAVAVDPSVVPAVVDLPYLTAVMAKLRMLDLQYLAVLQGSRQVSPEVIALLHAEYSQPEFDNEVTSASDFLLKPSPNLRPIAERGPVITTPVKILTNTRQCISFLVTEDFSNEAARPVAVGTDLIVLRPIERTSDPQRLNPTPWQISFSIIPQDPSSPTSNENLCVA